MSGWMTIRKQVLLVSAGALLCLFAAPAGVLAGTPSTQTVAPNSSAAKVLTTTGDSTTDTCGYADKVTASSNKGFSENELAQAIDVIGSGSSAKIAAFGSDEASILLGIEGQINGGNGHVSNPSLGDTSVTDPSHRLVFPSIYITDVTGNASLRSGDWQQGGTPVHHIDDIFGSWTTASGAPLSGNYHATKPLTANGWNLGPGSDVPANGFSALKDYGYGTEVRWNASGLVDNTGHALAGGHVYRFQVILHDGDQNKSGGDSGELCVNLSIPGLPTPSTLNAHIYQQGTTTEVPGGQIRVDFPAGPAVSANPLLNQTVTPGQSQGVSATAPAKWTFVNTATVNGVNQTPTLASNGTRAALANPVTVPAGQSSTVAFFVKQAAAPEATFSLAKTVDKTSPQPAGTILTYTVKLTNTSPTVDGTPGLIDDVLSATGGSNLFQLQGTPVASDGGTVASLDPQHFTWLAKSLVHGTSSTLTLRVKALTSGTITNTVYDESTNCPTAGVQACTVSTTVVAPQLTLDKKVDKANAAIGDTLTYTIKVGNTGTADATNVVVDDVLGGTAGFIVNDGTNGALMNSFAGSPATSGFMVTKVAGGHYQWTYLTVKPGDVDTVTFTAVIEAPGTVTTNLNGIVTLTNTASVVSPQGVTPVTVSTTAPLAGSPPGAVQGITTTPTPSTGARLNVMLAGLVFLAGLGLIMLGVLVRKRDNRIS